MPRRLTLNCLGAVVLSTTAGTAENYSGKFIYASEHACQMTGKLSAEQCSNAATNAQAEFEAKAPRFPTRAACERVFLVAGCSLGFKGAAGWIGRKSAIYFSPRQAGFRVSGSSSRDVTATPFLVGREVRFSSRTIMKKDTGIDARVAQHARESWIGQMNGRQSILSGSAATLGMDAPRCGRTRRLAAASRGPNFDCASYPEPGARDHAGTVCYLRPMRRR